MSSTAASAAQGAASAALAALAESYWNDYLRMHPTEATALGDRRFDALLEDNTAAGREAERAWLEGVKQKAVAISAAALSDSEQVTRSALIDETESGLARLGCNMENWRVDPLGGPQVEFFNYPDYTVIRSPKEAADFVTRCRKMGPYLDAEIANLRVGLAGKRVASTNAVRKVIEQLDRTLAQSTDQWALMAPALSTNGGVSSADSATFARDLRAALDESLRPALARYHAFLRDSILSQARPQDKAGIGALPDGVECYRALIKVHTSLDKSPEELHAVGLAEIAKFRKDLADLGQKVFGTSDVHEIQKRLRTDPKMHFVTGGEVEAKAREALARAKAAIPQWFGILPKADCVVKVMGMHEAPQSTIAYYRQPATDGSRPGTYMINTYKPETRPRYEAEALAFHEAIPGHHLQIAIAQELANIPEFRKHLGVTAFVEGWALYTERLSDEMGLYSSDTDRLGKLSFDAWRACRLVVDTGMHALGWSRQQAIDYMIENSVLAENNIENEVDRYLTWPGQALAYKTGQLEILALRDEGKKRLGSKFDIKGFHDVVLKNGAVSLTTLREQVEKYYASVEGKGPNATK